MIESFHTIRHSSDVLKTARATTMQSCPWGEILTRTGLLPEDVVKQLGTKCCNIRTLAEQNHPLAKMVTGLIDTDPVFAILWPPSIEHVARYLETVHEIKKHFTNKHKIVLDFGCGSGDGTRLLGRQLPKNLIIGLDHDLSVIEEANTMPKPKNVLFCSPDNQLNHTPDVIVALEVLEHVADPATTVIDIKNKLPKNGILIASCPNVNWLPEGARNHLFDPVLNPDHPSEPSFTEFKGWFKTAFNDVTIFGQGITKKEFAPYMGLKHLLNVAIKLPEHQGLGFEIPLLWTHNNLRRVLTWTIVDNAITEFNPLTQEPMTFFAVAKQPKH